MVLRPFDVFPYSIARLERLLSEESLADAHIIKDKLHRTYFEEYFANIGAKTIVVENNYVDGDYLDDYAAYLT